MNTYVTGSMIKKLREERSMTQAALAERLMVSDKAISKWETGKGYPDITLVAPLAEALGVSVMELMTGSRIINKNRAFNMRRLQLYVCPLCGNILCSCGEAFISCCGITLPPLEAEIPDEAHKPSIRCIEDEYCLVFDHEMTKDHSLSFVMAVRDDGYELIKLYPEGNAEVRFPIRKTRRFYAFCNRHGLFKIEL